jgi:hypothetical protein
MWQAAIPPPTITSDKVYEIEVLKYLVQTFDGGCSFGEFLCSDAMSLFVGYDTRDWFSVTSI